MESANHLFLQRRTLFGHDDRAYIRDNLIQSSGPLFDPREYTLENIHHLVASIADNSLCGVSLIIESSNISETDLGMIIKALETNTTLCIITFRARISTGNMLALAQALRKNKTLKSLCLSPADIDHEYNDNMTYTAPILAEIITETDTLEKIKYFGKEFNGDNKMRIEQAIDKNTTLIETYGLYGRHGRYGRGNTPFQRNAWARIFRMLALMCERPELANLVTCELLFRRLVIKFARTLIGTQTCFDRLMDNSMLAEVCARVDQYCTARWRVK